MKDLPCDTVRDLLPEFGAGTLGAGDGRGVEAHLAGCRDCRQELEVLNALLEARPEPPPELEARIQDRVRLELGEDLAVFGTLKAVSSPEAGRRVIPLFGRPRRVPAWALSAAAVLVLAVGTSRIWLPGSGDLVQDPIVVANQEPLPEAWLWDDGMIAGAPVFDGLSDEELEALLEELEG